MKVSLEMLPGSINIPQRTEVAPLLFSEAKDGGVKTLVPCRDGEVAWRSITSGWTRHEFTRDKECWRVAFVSKDAKNTPKAGEMWLCKYAGENPRQTVWFVEPIQKMLQCGDRFLVGIVRDKEDNSLLWITEDPRRMWWPDDLCLHPDGRVGTWNRSTLLPSDSALARHIVDQFKADITGWQAQTYNDSPICALSLTGTVLIGEKDDKSYYKHYGLKDITATGLYKRVMAEVEDCPALRLEDEEIVQGKGTVFVIRKDDGNYWLEIAGENSSERFSNFEAQLTKLGIKFEKASEVQSPGIEELFKGKESFLIRGTWIKN